MCNFLESNTWLNPGFNGAIEAALNFGQGTAMMNYAKAQNSRYAPQVARYPVVTGSLQLNRIYRGAFWVDAIGVAPEIIPNHEIIIITGGNPGDIVYFEPNFGFYQPTIVGGLTNRGAMENEIRGLYLPTHQVRNFEYLNVRNNTGSGPLSFF